MSSVIVSKEKTEILRLLNNNLKQAFEGINDEFEEHLEAINETSSEIQENYAYLCELDNKISKLNERIDEVHLILSKITGKKANTNTRFEDIDPLTTMEKNIFLNLYSEEKPITFAELASKVNMPIAVVREYITNLIEKGIPIHKDYLKTRPHISLDKKFKNLQAKTNILKIEQKILL